MQFSKLVPVVAACAAVAQGAALQTVDEISDGQVELPTGGVSQSTAESSAYATETSTSTVIAPMCANGTISGSPYPTIAPPPPSNGTMYPNGSDCEEGDDDCDCEEVETGTPDYQDEPKTNGTITYPEESPDSNDNAGSTAPAPVPTAAPVPTILATSAATVQKASFAAAAIVGAFFVFFL